MGIGTRITVTESAEMLRRATCDSCGASYVYLQKIDGAGTGQTFLDVNGEATTKKAEEAAKKELRANIEKIRATGKHAPTACPSCGHYSRDMQADATHKRSSSISCMIAGSLFIAGIAVFVCSALCGLISAYLEIGSVRQPIPEWLKMTLGTIVLGLPPLGIVGLPILYLIYRMQDINSPALKAYRVAHRDNNALLENELEDLLINRPPWERGAYKKFFDNAGTEDSDDD